MGQSVPISSVSFDGDIRSLQLAGKISPQYSLTIRPFSPGDQFTLDTLFSLLKRKENRNIELRSIGKSKSFFRASLLPVSLLTKFTTHHPYGWSDGALLPSHGLQTILSAGLFAKAGPLTIQALPEWSYAINNPYELTNDFGNESPIKNHKRFLPGQSRVALNAGPFSAAISSENIWWGPGQFTSLIMSNNAPGFYHLTFNTRRPFKTPIGSFQWQIVSGRLEDELMQSEEAFHLKSSSEVFYNFERLNWKYLNAISFSFQPSFLKGITVGLSRSFMTDGENIKNGRFGNESFARNYLPVFDKLFKSRLTNEDERPWNQLAAIYMRILFPASHAETYFEYGWNDHKYNLRDLLMSPFHSASYLVGLKKTIKVNSRKWIDLSAEINQMEMTVDEVVRNSGSWYRHYQNESYSHFGQILGSGIGYGSNYFVTSATLRNGFDQKGVFFERVQRSPKDFNTRWTDYAIGVMARRQCKNMILTGRLSGVQSNNYGWVEKKDRFQIVGLFSMMYVL